VTFTFASGTEISVTLAVKLTTGENKGPTLSTAPHPREANRLASLCPAAGLSERAGTVTAVTSRPERPP